MPRPQTTSLAHFSCNFLAKHKKQKKEYKKKQKTKITKGNTRQTNERPASWRNGKKNTTEKKK